MTILYRALVCTAFAFGMQTNAGSQTLHWVKQFGSTNNDEGVGIATDGTGNVYSVGHFYDTIDFDPGPGILNLVSNGWPDVFISKMDAAGNLIWAKQIGGTDWVECNAVTTDNNGNFYITGSFLGTVDFDPSPATLNLSSTDDINIFICKFDPLGNIIWAKQVGGLLAVNAYAIAADNAGNVYTTGYFDATADLDPGPGVFNLTAQGYSDIFVSKLDTAGNFVWAKQMGGVIGEVGYAIAVDDSSNVYTTGVFTGTVDFDPGQGSFNLSTASAGNGDIFLSKLDASGNFVWAKNLGGEEAHAIALDNIGNIYVGGSGYNSWNNISVNKLDPAGNSIWVKQIAASMCYALAIDNGNNVYTTGQFFGTVDFDPGASIYTLTAMGNTDSYISELDSAGSFIAAKQLGGTYQVYTRSLAVDANKNIYTTGYFWATADFDPSPTASASLTSVGGFDIFVHKMEPDVTLVWDAGDTGVFKVYPNPTTGKIFIELKDHYRLSRVVLRDLTGRIITQKAMSNVAAVPIEIGGANGVYVLELYDQSGGKTLTRVIKD